LRFCGCVLFSIVGLRSAAAGIEEDDMRKIYALGVLALGGIPFAAHAAFASSDPAAVTASATCMAVAEAKFDQWQQPRLLIRKTKSFAKGNQLEDEMIVSANTAYGLHLGHWSSGNITRPQRGAHSADRVLAHMGLAECDDGGTTHMSGQPVKVYNFTYVPDRDGFAAHGTIWISQSTGLPLREDLHEAGPPANRMVATDISATYAYNADVEIPAEAEGAEQTRLFDTRFELGRFEMMESTSGMAGEAPRQMGSRIIR
jgi:hypothetical protein